MSRGVNKVIIIGNLGVEPETRYMPSGNAVTNLSIATSESWKDKQTGQTQERTEWHRITLYNRLAEIAGEYLRKGSKVYIEGSIRTNKWQDQSGNDRYTTEVIANNMQMLDSRGDATASAPASNSNFMATNSMPTNTNPAASQTAPQQQHAPAMAAEFDDDIPF